MNECACVCMCVCVYVNIYQCISSWTVSLPPSLPPPPLSLSRRPSLTLSARSPSAVCTLPPSPLFSPLLILSLSPFPPPLFLLSPLPLPPSSLPSSSLLLIDAKKNNVNTLWKNFLINLSLSLSLSTRRAASGIRERRSHERLRAQGTRRPSSMKWRRGLGRGWRPGSSNPQIPLKTLNVSKFPSH